MGTETGPSTGDVAPPTPYPSTGADLAPASVPGGLGPEDPDLSGARILLVDDDAPNLKMLGHVLEFAGFHHLTSVTDPRQVEEICAEDPPDLVILDMLMPYMDGVEVMKVLRDTVPDPESLPVLILTSDASRETKRRALSNGARDFLTKPVSPAEVRLRVVNHLRTRFLQLQLRGYNERLEKEVDERTAELEEARIETLEKLALAAEYRDDETGEHTRRVGILSESVGRRLGLEDDRLEALRRAAPLHDVGKIGIDDAILLKPGKLTEEEFEIMKTHTTIGAEILSGSRFQVMQMAESIALCHHENWDGSGYPQGLEGEEIPLTARIVAVADVFDSLTHERVYKEAIPEEEAIAILRDLRSRKFDPRVLSAFLELWVA